MAVSIMDATETDEHIELSPPIETAADFHLITYNEEALQAQQRANDETEYLDSSNCISDPYIMEKKG